MPCLSLYPLNKGILSKGPKGLCDSVSLTAKWEPYIQPWLSYLPSRSPRGHMRPCSCHKMCLKVIIGGSFGPDSALGDEFSSKESRLCPEGLYSLRQELVTFPSHGIFCQRRLYMVQCFPYTCVFALLLLFLEMGGLGREQRTVYKAGNVSEAEKQ